MGAHNSSRRFIKKNNPKQIAAWKKSPLVGAILVVVILICLISLLKDTFGSGSLIPGNFPHAYIAVEDNGKMDAILIKRGKTEIKTPFTEDNKEYWEAYICRNEACPWRTEHPNASYIFANVKKDIPADVSPENMDTMAYQEISCPLCKEASEKAQPNDKQKYDLSAVERYQTEEALKILDQIREEYKKRAKND